ncbi:MAG: APC family permease [Armatimonadota bacterium]
MSKHDAEAESTLAEDADAHPELTRSLGVTDCALLVIGAMVGTGIFLTTGDVAEKLPSPFLILVAWLLGGVFALAGALTYAELGAAFPRAGGHYVYMREAYGPLAGFLDGWVSFVATFPCSIAFMAVGVAAYLSHFLPAFAEDNVIATVSLWRATVTLHAGHFPALAAVLALTAVNCLALRVGATTQNALTALKIICILGLALLGLGSGKGAWSNLVATGGGATGLGVLPALAGALIGVSFAYLGWDAATYMGAEAREPQKILPRSLAAGTILVVALYLLFNLALLYLVPVAEMSGERKVAQDAAAVVLGRAGAGVISAAIILCILGAMNATIMIAPRIYYAMAEDGLFFRGLARVHPRFKVPTTAIIVQGVWTCIIVVTGTAGSILTYSVFAILVLSTATAAGVFVLRARRPGLHRPYGTWGYPIVPAIYCLGSLGILVNTLVHQPWQSAWSLVAVALGVPVYWYWRERSRGGSVPA